MLFTILSTINAFANFTDVLAGKTTNVEFMKESGTLFFLLFKDAKHHWAKSSRTSARNAQFKAKSLGLPFARPKAIALFTIVGLNKKTTFVTTQGI